MFVIRTTKRDELQKYLKVKGIGTLIHYPIPPYKQKAYKEFNHIHLPPTEKIHQEVLSLPISPMIKDSEALRVSEAVNLFQ